MSYEIGADYDQHYLLPPRIEDWVPQDHPARFIREYIDALDLKNLGFNERKARDGRPNYRADLLLKVWTYGYFMRIYSTRKLEQACREHMGMIWLTGNNAPDHNTLWRFFRDHRKALRKIFKEGLVVAAKAELVGMVLHAVDGTKIKAKVATRNGWDRKDLKKLLKRMDGSIDEMMHEVERLEGEEIGEYRLPEGLDDPEKLKATIKELLQEMDEIDRDHLHPNDKEARMMKGDGWTRFAYNAQAVVDKESGLIVAEDVVNDEGDAHQLTRMIDQVAETLGESAEETVADGGYYSGEELAKAENKGYNVIVSMRKSTGNYHSSHFEYDPQRNICMCPEGKELPYQRTKLGRGKRYRVQVYQCKNHRECPYRWQCSRDKNGRQIEISEYHGAILRQRDKQKHLDNLEKLRKRKTIVEPVFGQIKECMGFTRFTVNGLEWVKTQWSLLCTVVNLKKMYKWWREGRLVIRDLSLAPILTNTANLLHGFRYACVPTYSNV